ncbi:phosphotransferase enzyme family protein [Nucisporomicrobium flavum]|uniref:phosphotransferase enzyme family protein n=1 Tax=Nucisporomicrobium flavum TaxID=2785915 RepID=UPI0018F364D7|nr:phosphotransferase [Nucisporomicrobium flavum]
MNASAIARLFGLGAATRLSDGPVARGKQGVVWRLDTADGRWAVKVPFHPADDGGSAAFQEAACAAGVPAPRVRRTAEGQVFASVDGVRVRVYEWVDLGAPDPNLDPELVGTALAALHRVRVETAGPVHPWYTEPVGPHRWDELVASLRREGAPFADRLAALRDELVALESWIEPPANLQTCHRDLWADNVLPTADGGICVIDWENSGAADPAQELACALFEFARHDRGRVRALTAAYRSAGGPATLSRRGDFSMLIAQLGHITEAAASDWLNPGPRSPDRAAATAWISEVLDDPHSRTRLALLLE